MHAAGEIKKARLYDLDRVSGYDHRFSVLVKAEKYLEKLNLTREQLSKLNKLRKLVDNKTI